MATKKQLEKIDVVTFIKKLNNKNIQETAMVLVSLFEEVTGSAPVMWGSIFGFGSYHYMYESGREGDSLATGFAIRKSGPVLYIMQADQDYSEMLKNLGPHKIGKSCLYLKNLEDVDVKVLKGLILLGLRDLKRKHSVIL